MNDFHLDITNKVDELSRLSDAVEKLGIEWGLAQGLRMHLNLVLEEIVSNIIFYAYDDPGKHSIHVEIIKDGHALKIKVTDDGRPFNMLDFEPFRDIDKTAGERKVGGLGIHFVKTLSDRVEYRRSEDKNILTLHKNI